MLSLKHDALTFLALNGLVVLTSKGSQLYYFNDFSFLKNLFFSSYYYLKMRSKSCFFKRFILKGVGYKVWIEELNFAKILYVDMGFSHY